MSQNKSAPHHCMACSKAVCYIPGRPRAPDPCRASWRQPRGALGAQMALASGCAGACCFNVVSVWIQRLSMQKHVPKTQNESTLALAEKDLGFHQGLGLTMGEAFIGEGMQACYPHAPN